MAKERGKKTKRTAKSRTKSKKSKAVKSDFQKKKVTYTDVKSSINPEVKDEEFRREIKELETGNYYGARGEKKADSPIEKKEVGKPKVKSMLQKKVSDGATPNLFYIASIFAAFLFTAYISIFAAIHFDDIGNMNIMVVFLFISMVSYFLISAMFFISEKKQWHAAAPILFFIGIVAIMIYAFKAVDTSDLVRFSIIYTIIVTAVSAYALIVKR